jgi:HupE/UreJ protein
MIIVMRMLSVVLLCFGMIMPIQVVAHDLGLAQVTVSAQADGTVVLHSKLSATIDAEVPVIPGVCTGRTRSLIAPDRLNQRFETRITCPSGSDGGQILLPWQVDGVFLISQSVGQQSETRFVPAGAGGVTLEIADLRFQDRGWLEVANLYAQLGIEHILIGLDHLALLLCLALLARGWILVRLVTAFTIGHSITLCLAALQVVQVPIAPVEVLIVLSVAYLARDVWLGRTFDRNSTYLLVGIGLLHGLGFASVLSEIGLPRSDLLVALFSFNIGVEIGQLLFLTAAVLVHGLVARVISAQLKTAMPYAVSFFLGSISMYWTFERVLGFY